MHQCLLTILLAVTLCKVSDTLSIVHIMKREEGCPVFKDTTWKYRNSRCPSGKQYHCFQNGDNSIVDGCFASKLCRRGAHPVVEGMNIVCDLCRTGFQSVDKLNTTTYTLSFCTPHSSECDPSNGQTLCREGTRERNRACTCNATLGFSPSSLSSGCQCFTPNDICSMCKFVGCLNGYTRNNDGYCEPAEVEESTVTSVPTVGSTTNERQAVPLTDDGLPGWAVALIILFFVVYILPWILLCVLSTWLHERCHRALCEREGTAESTQTRVQPDKTCFIILILILPWFPLVLSWKKGWLKILCMKESAKRPRCRYHPSSLLAQEPRSQPDQLDETMSEPVQPATENAEPLLPTASPSGLTDPPTGPTVPPSGPTASSPVLPPLGPYSHPLSSDPSAPSGPAQPAYKGAEPLLPAEPPLGLTVLPSVPTTPPFDPPLLGGPHPHPLSSDLLAAPEPSASPPLLPYQDQDGVGSDSKANSG